MSTHTEKDSLTDSLIAESKETALGKPLKLREEISDKKQFNTNGPGSRFNEEPILESTVGVKGSPNTTNDCSRHPKKSKSTDNVSQDGHSARRIRNQNEPKPSDTSHKESETDGQWIFIDTVPDFMKCKICSSVFESPQLLSCCGTNICKKCMDRYLQRLATLADQQPLCPFCRSTDFKLINNIALEQSINQLKVKCYYQRRGCDWTGILENGNLHFKECGFASIDCPNGCGCERFERRRLPDHLLVCPHTCTTCLFETIGCDTKVPLQHQAGQKHANDCLSKHLHLIAQQNTDLSKDYQKLYTFLQSESYTDVSAVCNKLVRSQREALASTEHTIKSLKESIQEAQQQIATLKTELRRGEICLAALHKTISETKNTEAAYKESIVRIQTIPVPQGSGLSCVPVTFIIDNFRRRIKLNDIWLSPPFYTHVGGYKMCLSVRPDCSESRGAYKRSVSVNIHFLAGEFDEHLTWPFPGAVFTITAINQRANKCNRSVNLELVGKHTHHIRSKPVGDSLSFGFGAPDFLFHSDLPAFLCRDNSFKLMVYRIQFLPL